MYIELHILQNFAPSNLNRSDTGAPKDCEFGGVRRARISSQCLKRAMREHFKTTPLQSADKLALRSKRLHKYLFDEVQKRDCSFDNLQYCAEAIVALAGVSLVEKQQEVDGEDGQTETIWAAKSEVLAFLGKDALKEVVEIMCNSDNKDSIQKAGTVFKEYREAKRSRKDYKGSISKEDKKNLRDKVKKALGKDVAEKIEKALDGSKAADLALFGRMLADLPGKNVNAASQVAHAISTNKTGIEFDFYTAVDDLRPEDTEGADMLGTIEFNSACFYRYANVNFKHLSETNLAGDAELARDTIEAFIRAAILAVPTGKQNSMAAQNLPSFVFAVARKSGLWSLANAFVKPVRPDAKNDLVEKSIAQLGDYWGQHSTMYGDGEIVDCCYVNLQGQDVEGFADGKNNQKRRAASVDELVGRMRRALGDDDANKEGGAQ